MPGVVWVRVSAPSGKAIAFLGDRTRSGRVFTGAFVAQQAGHRHLKGGHRAAGRREAEQVTVPLAGHRLAPVGQHDRYAITDLVAAAQSRVIQEVVLGQVQQCLLVDRAGQQAQQQGIQTHWVRGAGPGPSGRAGNAAPPFGDRARLAR